MFQLIFKNSFFKISFQLFQAVFGMLLIPYTISKVGDKHFGIYIFSLSLFNFNALLDMGLSTSLVKEVASCKNNPLILNEIFKFYFSFYSIIGFIGAIFIAISPFMIKPFLSDDYFGDNTLYIIVLILSVQLLFNFCSNVFYGFLNAYEKMVTTSLVNSISVFGNYLTTFILLYFNFGVISIVLSIVVWNMISKIVLIYSFKSYFKNIEIVFCLKSIGLFKQRLKFNSVIFICQISDMIVRMSDQIFIGIFYPIGITKYEIGLRLNQYSRIALEQFISSIFPSLASKSDDESSIKQIIILGTKYSFMMYTPLYIGIISFGFYFIKAWLGEDYSYGSYLVLVLLSSSTYIHTFDSITQWHCISKGQLKGFVPANIIGAVVNIILCICLVNSWLNIYGIALASVLTYVFIGIPFGISLRKASNIKLSEIIYQSWLPCFVPALGIILPGWLYYQFIQQGIINNGFLIMIPFIIFSIILYGIIFIFLPYNKREKHFLFSKVGFYK
jgi:O-antigen/teichoic acid export membrane protein